MDAHKLLRDIEFTSNAIRAEWLADVARLRRRRRVIGFLRDVSMTFLIVGGFVVGGIAFAVALGWRP